MSSMAAAILAHLANQTDAEWADVARTESVDPLREIQYVAGRRAAEARERAAVAGRLPAFPSLHLAQPILRGEQHPRQIPDQRDGERGIRAHQVVEPIRRNDHQRDR